MMRRLMHVEALKSASTLIEPFHVALVTFAELTAV